MYETTGTTILEYIELSSNFITFQCVSSFFHIFPIEDVPIFPWSKYSIVCSQLSITKHLLVVAQQPHRAFTWQPVPAAAGQSTVKLVVGHQQPWLENDPGLKMYSLLKMGIFQPAMFDYRSVVKMDHFPK